jgi:hypothetical protein
MQTDDNVSSPLSRVKHPESLKLQLAAFQTHLKEVEEVIQVLAKYSPTELDSYKLIEKLLIVKIGQLKGQIEKMGEDNAANDGKGV